MTVVLAGLAGALIASTLTILLTPLVKRVAVRLDFLDRPREYRQHARPTPFLGGSAVMIGFLTAALVVGAARHLHVVLAAAVVMWALGTLDDRVAVEPKWRLLAEVLAATALHFDGLGWRIPGVPGPVLLLLTITWTVALVNAFNLMDNQDGACATVGAVSSVGIGLLAALHGDAVLCGTAFALAGACTGFLRFNLARPAHIFLGDGGSMLIGFLVAALGMAAGRGLNDGFAGFVVVVMTAGTVIFDTTMVSVSRTRRGVTLLTGGRDHLTHRLLRPLKSPQRVAISLASAQALLCGVAVAGYELGAPAAIALAGALTVAGCIGIAKLDSDGWRPAGIAYGSRSRMRTTFTVPELGVSAPVFEAAPGGLAPLVSGGSRPFVPSVDPVISGALTRGVGRITGRPLSQSPSEPDRATVPHATESLSELRVPEPDGTSVSA